MICKNCGADFESDRLHCPYCNTVNEEALKMAKELQEYDKDYEETREEMLNDSGNIVLKKMIKSLLIAFIILAVLFGAFFAYFQYRYGDTSKYEVTGERYEKNKAKVEKYLNEGQYIRAYLLAADTDPTHEYFTYYPEHKDELTAIYTYSLVLDSVRRTMQDMDNGDNYKAFDSTMAIMCSIFYCNPDNDIKLELEKEVDTYLVNLYRLTEDELAEYKAIVKELDGHFISTDFSLEGKSDYESVSKERMVAYYGK